MNSRKRKRTSLCSTELSAYRDQHFKVVFVYLVICLNTANHTLKRPRRRSGKISPLGEF